MKCVTEDSDGVTKSLLLFTLKFLRQGGRLQKFTDGDLIDEFLRRVSGAITTNVINYRRRRRRLLERLQGF